MADFNEELVEGDIHIRDQYQFELKSEYTPLLGSDKNTYTLETFFFIPTALRINRDTYSKQQFYYDVTNFIRLKTPGYSLKQLGDPGWPDCPLKRVQALYDGSEQVDEEQVIEELKLYANIVRSAVRKRVRGAIDNLHRCADPDAMSNLAPQLVELGHEIKQLRQTFISWQDNLGRHWQQGRMKEYVQYIDEFISNVIEQYAVNLLQEIAATRSEALAEARRVFASLVAWESDHRLQRQERSPFADDPERKLEYAVYRGGLLKKFVSEALFLSLTRKEPLKTFQQVTAAVAAGVAMALYIYFLSFYSVNPVWDSTAFIILSVMLYVLKDRLKEGIKNASTKLAADWFPDFHTLIRTPGGEVTLGYLNEYFSFLKPAQVPPDISDIRNTRFHTELERARRQEEVFLYRKEVALLPKLVNSREGHPYELNDIFRYTIHRFLFKASDPYKEQLIYDPSTQEVQHIRGPKVYHINIIIRKRFLNQQKHEETEYKKFRIVLDKNGIKRIEKVG